MYIVNIRKWTCLKGVICPLFKCLFLSTHFVSTFQAMNTFSAQRTQQSIYSFSKGAIILVYRRSQCEATESKKKELERKKKEKLTTIKITRYFIRRLQSHGKKNNAEINKVKKFRKKEKIKYQLEKIIIKQLSKGPQQVVRKNNVKINLNKYSYSSFFFLHNESPFHSTFNLLLGFFFLHFPSNATYSPDLTINLTVKNCNKKDINNMKKKILETPQKVF